MGYQVWSWFTICFHSSAAQGVWLGLVGTLVPHVSVKSEKDKVDFSLILVSLNGFDFSVNRGFFSRAYVVGSSVQAGPLFRGLVRVMGTRRSLRRCCYTGALNGWVVCMQGAVDLGTVRCWFAKGLVMWRCRCCRCY
jgi:hypothetical protein